MRNDDIVDGLNDLIETWRSLPAELCAVVERQDEGVQRNHSQVRLLRDQARAANP